MIVLAVDSTAVCATAAACLFENDRLVTYALTTSKNGLTHSETLLPIADGVLRLLGKQMDEVGLFAVSAGPGSFTGVRIGVSLVKGLAFAGGTPCAAVSPLEALAKAHEAFPGVVCAVMDARRGQYYNALFQNGERLCSDRAIDTDALLAELGSGPVLVCGDGAALLCERARAGESAPRARILPGAERAFGRALRLPALVARICGHAGRAFARLPAQAAGRARKRGTNEQRRKQRMIALGCDHGGLEIKNAIAADLRARGVEYKDVGTFTEASVDYPVYARAVCDEITSGRAEFGILCCGTGIGMSIAANKRRGIRAAVLSDAFSAEMTRRHNDANVLCLGGRVIDAAKAVELARIFLATPFEGGRHAKRVAMLEE